MRPFIERERWPGSRVRVRVWKQTHITHGRILLLVKSLERGHWTGSSSSR